MECTNEELFEKAKKCDILVLDDDRVSTITDSSGDTPLHDLALFSNDIDAMIKHPMISKVKDIGGNTPLHYLARRGKNEILQHPDCNIVRNNHGSTPTVTLDTYHILNRR